MLWLFLFGIIMDWGIFLFVYDEGVGDFIVCKVEGFCLLVGVRGYGGGGCRFIVLVGIIFWCIIKLVWLLLFWSLGFFGGKLNLLEFCMMIGCLLIGIEFMFFCFWLGGFMGDVFRGGGG